MLPLAFVSFVKDEAGGGDEAKGGTEPVEGALRAVSGKLCEQRTTGRLCFFANSIPGRVVSLGVCDGLAVSWVRKSINSTCVSG